MKLDRHARSVACVLCACTVQEVKVIDNVTGDVSIPWAQARVVHEVPWRIISSSGDTTVVLDHTNEVLMVVPDVF